MTHPRDVIEVGPGFWNLRGSFKLGPIDIGTQSSLVEREGGVFVLLDACTLSAEAHAWVDAKTSDGGKLEAVLHLHPFHTLHVRAIHQRYPKAKLYGTSRHRAKASDLPWEARTTDDPSLHEEFADELDFTVPRGVELIPDDENLHFSSVLAFHRASRTLHVDDTLTYVKLPKLLRGLKKDVLRFHPTLGKVLERRPGAAADFRAWGAELVERCRDVDHVCAAHSAVLRDGDVAGRVQHALDKAEKTLRRHEDKHG